MTDVIDLTNDPWVFLTDDPRALNDLEPKTVVVPMDQILVVASRSRRRVEELETKQAIAEKARRDTEKVRLVLEQERQRRRRLWCGLSLAVLLLGLGACALLAQ